MLLEKKIQEIKNFQTLIDDYEKKGWSLRIKETNNLLDDLTKQKNQHIETQMKIQEKIDSINEYNANQEVSLKCLLYYLSDLISESNTFNPSKCAINK